MRTLAVHVGGIGDLLLTAPAITRLAADGPVELVGYRDRLELLVAAGLATAAHELIAVDFESIFSEPTPRLREFLGRFDRVIVWMRDDGRILERLRDCGVAEPFTFSGLPLGRAPIHASAYYLACLGYDSGPEACRLNLPLPSGAARIGALDVVIHPGSGGRLKNWSMDAFAEVAAGLASHGRRVTWCSGPAEEGRYFPAKAKMLPLMSLVELGARLATARLYLGNDSGVTHLAAVVGTPVVAVFGPTEPRVWAPLGEQVVVAQGAPWPAPAVVLEKCLTQLEKAPENPGLLPA